LLKDEHYGVRYYRFPLVLFSNVASRDVRSRSSKHCSPGSVRRGRGSYVPSPGCFSVSEMRARSSEISVSAVREP